MVSTDSHGVPSYFKIWYTILGKKACHHLFHEMLCCCHCNRRWRCKVAFSYLFREHFSNSINLGFLGKIHYQNCVVHVCVVVGFVVVHHKYFSVFLQVPTKQLLKISKIRNYSISNHHQIFCYLLYVLALIP